jgi:hypothetical protein
MEKIVTKNVLALADAYAAATGKSLSTVSKQFYGSSYFFRDLRAREASISIRRLEQMLDQFRASWPEGVAWPVMMPILIKGPPRQR